MFLIPPPPTKYNLVVNSGTGSGSYEEGTLISITANATSNTFWKWTGTGENSVYTPNYTYTMPSRNVTWTANYGTLVTGNPVVSQKIWQSQGYLHLEMTPKNLCSNLATQNVSSIIFSFHLVNLPLSANVEVNLPNGQANIDEGVYDIDFTSKDLNAINGRADYLYVRFYNGSTIVAGCSIARTDMVWQ